jgi:Myb-like DNA-binding protein FlbD
VSRNGK